MFLLMPGLVEAQANARSHTVIQGQTLWELAESYCGDPFRWPEIFQANRSQISDPDVVLPEQVLTISCAPGEVSGVQVVTADPVRGPAPPFDERAKKSIFYRDLSATVAISARPPQAVMSRDASWSAEWLLLGSEDPWAAGSVARLLSGETARTAMPYQRVRVAAEARAELGDIYQVFRVDRLIEGLGTVVVPTGVLSVIVVKEGGFEGVVLKSYDRIVQGDLVAPAPDFTLEPGDEPSAVSSSATAEILTFGELHSIQQLGDIALLDKGSADGVSVGDEYVLVVGGGDGWSGDVAGRLQVVRVTEGTASARLIKVDQPEFRPGQEVRLDRKMR